MIAENVIETMKQVNRVVIKIGSALLIDEKNGSIRSDWLSSIADDVATLKKQGKDVIFFRFYCFGPENPGSDDGKKIGRKPSCRRHWSN